MADPSSAGPRDHDMRLEPTFRKWQGRLIFSRATKCYMPPHQAGRLQTGVYALILPQHAWQPSRFVSMTGRRGSSSALARGHGHSVRCRASAAAGNYASVALKRF